jgi:hypothetical protein
VGSKRAREKNKEASTVEWIKRKVRCTLQYTSAEGKRNAGTRTAAFKRRRRRL